MATLAERVLGNGRHIQATADNATATATAPASASQVRNILFGVGVSYSGAVTASKTITVDYTDPQGTAQTFTLRRDFTYGGATITFPGPIVGKQGTAASAALEASGTGGVIGTIVLFYATI